MIHDSCILVCTSPGEEMCQFRVNSSQTGAIGVYVYASNGVCICLYVSTIDREALMVLASAESTSTERSHPREGEQCHQAMNCWEWHNLTTRGLPPTTGHVALHRIKHVHSDW